MALLAFPLVHLLYARGAREGHYYGYFDFLGDWNLVEGKDNPLGNFHLTPEQKGWIWLKETRLRATLSLHDPDWAHPPSGGLARVGAKTLGEGGK